jgi:hypothetical protein
MEKYFAAMVDVARHVNPRMSFWVYDSWGTRDIVQHRSRYPNFINIDWGVGLGPIHYRQYVPRSSWYLFHRGSDRFPEFSYKHASVALKHRGLEAMQIRAVAYRDFDNAFQAFEEFSWNPCLPLDQYAKFYIGKHLRQRDPEMIDLYVSWMNLVGYRDLASDRAGRRVLYENPNQESDQRQADEARRKVGRLIGEVQNSSELVSAIRAQFESLK